MYEVLPEKLRQPPRALAKILLIMRLTTLILITAILQVSASSHAQKISLTERNASLTHVLERISAQTGFDFLYESAKLKDIKNITIDVQNEELKEVLSKVLEPRALEFTIEDNSVIIKEKEPSLASVILKSVQDLFQSIDVTGRIVDQEGTPIPGATIRVKGTNRSVVSNESGHFAILNVDEDAIIVVSYVGFKTKEVAVYRADVGNIVLEAASSNLDEVQVIAYGTTTRRLSTSNIGTIKAVDIERQPVSNPIAALYGRIPGLVITQQTGIPGGQFKVEIRGQNSLRNFPGDNGNLPLYIVDGVPFSSKTLNTNAAQGIYPTLYADPGSSPLNSINPGDIESINILKDADATAIYGSRGANGVVLITTKKGKVGNYRIDANVYTGTGKVTRFLKMMNTEQYLEMRREAFSNDGITNYPVNAYDVNGTWDEHKYTDWQKELIGGNSSVINAQTSVSGGSENMQYRFGGNYYRETTVFPGDFADQRSSGHLTLNSSSDNKRFISQITVNYAIGKSDLFTQDLTSRAISYAPNAPDLLDDDGNLNWPTGVTQNHLQFTRQPYNAENNSLITNLTLGYEFAKDLMLKLSSGYTRAMREEISKNPNSTNRPSIQQLLQNTAQFGNSSDESWILEPQLSYHKQIGKHSFSGLIGSTLQSQSSRSLYQVAEGFSSEFLMGNISSVPNANVSNIYSNAKYRYGAIFGRLNYDYNNKYIVSLNGRRDGSSRFGPGKQFANFASVGLAWIFSNEDLIKDTFSWLNFGKLRGSYGSAGSDQTVNYGFLDLYSPSTSYVGVAGLGPKQLFNPDYAWERNRKMEATIDLGFLQDKLLFTIAYYRNQSSNQLVGYPLPPTTGFTSVFSNLNATVRNTGWEFELTNSNIRSKDFMWSSSFNLSIPKNKLISYPNIEGSSNKDRYVVGQPLNIVKLYQGIGISPTTGLYEVEDVDKNNIYNSIDKQHIGFIGQRFYGGLTNNIEWKNFQLDILLQFSKQYGRNYLTFLGTPGNMSNQPIEVLSRWKTSEYDGINQKYSQSSVSAQAYLRYRESDASVVDASFIRLKNAALSYRLPSSLLKSLGVKNARVYIQGQNLITVTKYKGLDPETQGTFLPPLFFLTGGLNLTL